MKILAFAGSNSSNSINKKLVSFVAHQFNNAAIEILDLNAYEMPLYSPDREKVSSLLQLAYDFAEKIDTADLLIISLAEYNGNYTAAFKNLTEWVSRIPERKIFGGKPVFLMATSPGQRGGETVLEIAKQRFPYDGAKIIETFSLPFFYEFFDAEKGIVNQEKLSELNIKMEKLKQDYKNYF